MPDIIANSKKKKYSTPAKGTGSSGGGSPDYTLSTLDPINDPNSDMYDPTLDPMYPDVPATPVATPTGNVLPPDIAIQIGNNSNLGGGSSSSSGGSSSSSGSSGSSSSGGSAAAPATDPNEILPYTDEELADMINKALDAEYGPQRDALALALEQYLLELDTGATTAEANLQNLLASLGSQEEKDIQALIDQHENAQLRSGGYNSALFQQYDQGQSDLMSAYEQEITAANNNYNAYIQNNQDQKAAYIEQMNQQLANLTAQQQRQYAATLLQMQYDQRMALLQHQWDTESSGGSGTASTAGTFTFDDLANLGDTTPFKLPTSTGTTRVIGGSSNGGTDDKNTGTGSGLDPINDPDSDMYDPTLDPSIPDVTTTKKTSSSSPAEGEIRTDTSGKQYIYRDGAWRTYIPDDKAW